MALQIIHQEKPRTGQLSILFYGFPKVGKTTEACKFPKPLVLECEPRGAQFVTGIDVVKIDDLSMLERHITEIVNSEHKTIVLDGFTWMAEQAAKQLKAKDPRQAYKQVGDRLSIVLGELLNSEKIIVATGHSRKVDDAEVRGKVEIRPDMNPDLSESVYGLFGIVCYCFPNGGGSMMATKPVDTERARILAGDRSGLLPAKMDLSAEEIMKCLRNGHGPVTEKQQ